MKKPWSITTTVRNPERLRDFLLVLSELEGAEWNLDNQKKYQILLIQHRKYGYKEKQFYNGLSQDDIDLIDNNLNEISFERAEYIFNKKNYEDAPMRGRQSANPLKKLGFVAIQNNKIKITNLGKLFLKDNFDFGEILFKSFLKWQIPNLHNRQYPEGGIYNIKPFIATLHLINIVNQKEISLGRKPKGISRREFFLFVPTLLHYEKIEQHAQIIINLRMQSEGKNKRESDKIFDDYREEFVSEFIESRDKEKMKGLLKNLKDYGDNTIRYFRQTKYIRIRGNGFYIDLEPMRSVELSALLSCDKGKPIVFKSKQEYSDYITGISKPELPWETTDKYIEIITKLVKEVRKYEIELGLEKNRPEDFSKMQDDALKEYIKKLRLYLQELQDKQIRKKAQSVEEIESCIKKFENICNFENRPILLEKLSSFGLYALNDAVKIQPNYPVGDDNEPTSTAPANTPDIECFYSNFNAICEVTMLKSRNQWYNEGQPVMRHLRDFEDKHSDKTAYCLFIAPEIHRDTGNTFWNAIKYEYEGSKQNIVPLSIKNFISILEILVQTKTANKFLKSEEISRLYDRILDSSNLFSDAKSWIDSIPKVIDNWQKSIGS